MDESPISGTLAGDDPAQAVAVTVDAAGLAAGSYACDLLVQSNDLGEPEIVVPVTLTVVDLPPAEPTGLVAIPGPGEGEISLSWDANSEPDLDHYRLERDTTPAFGPGSEPFDLPATSYQDSGLVPGGTYYYRVIAVDLALNESGPSAAASAAAPDLALHRRALWQLPARVRVRSH